MIYDRLGEQLVKKGLITEDQLQMALERQKLQGGRIGQNLVELEFISEGELRNFFKLTPQLPNKVEDTGLDISFLADLIMKHLLFMGEFTLSELADRVKLSLSVAGDVIEKLRGEQFIEIKGATRLGSHTYRYSLTDKGKNRSTELLEISRYAGPAPVRLRDYKEMVEVQTIKQIIVNKMDLSDAFFDLVVNENLLSRLGPAVSSGRTIFLYGPSGNGKTSIAEAIGRMLPGTIYVPHAVLVEGEIITVYDPVNHTSVQSEFDAKYIDPRWVQVRRPVILTGGELTLNELDLEFNSISKFYEAPLQMKANNGLFIIDDFGRQQVEPKRILNRWIVPLDRRTDFFSLHTGMKFEIPFDQLVIFATNLEPKSLVDEAFLRRIRYKVRIERPTLQEYKQIFKNICDSHNIVFHQEVFNYLIENYYQKFNLEFNACHPRDIVEYVMDDARYQGCSPSLTKETVSAACENYFVEI